MGMLWEFVRYKYSFHEYLYGFTREAQQTPSSLLHLWIFCSGAFGALHAKNPDKWACFGSL
jgi:hypothetical protein